MRQKNIQEILITLSFGIACVHTSFSLATVFSEVIGKPSLLFPKKVLILMKVKFSCLINIAGLSLDCKMHSFLLKKIH